MGGGGGEAEEMHFHSVRPTFRPFPLLSQSLWRGGGDLVSFLRRPCLSQKFETLQRKNNNNNKQQRQQQQYRQQCVFGVRKQREKREETL